MAGEAVPQPSQFLSKCLGRRSILGNLRSAEASLRRVCLVQRLIQVCTRPRLYVPLVVKPTQTFVRMYAHDLMRHPGRHNIYVYLSALCATCPLLYARLCTLISARKDPLLPTYGRRCFLGLPSALNPHDCVVLHRSTLTKHNHTIDNLLEYLKCTGGLEPAIVATTGSVMGKGHIAYQLSFVVKNGHLEPIWKTIELHEVWDSNSSI